MGKMINEISRLLLGSAEGAFLQVGSFVGGMLLIFGLANFVTHGGFIRTLERNRRWQPLFGALLGVSPGCGGAIFVMPLFVRGVVSFGTVVATLVATAGDSAFVLIAAQPLYAVVCYAGCLAVGIASGYVVDFIGFGANLAGVDPKYEEAVTRHGEIESEIPPQGEAVVTRQLPHVGHEEGDAVDMAMHHLRKPRPISLGYIITHRGYVFYWMLLALGLVLGVLLLLKVDVSSQLGAPLGFAVGVGGTAASIVFVIAGRTFMGDDTLESEEHKLFSLRETLVHSAGDTAFVTTWVFAAYFAYELFVYALGGADHAHGEEEMKKLMQAAGLMAVFAGALIGLIPGCGPQIIFVALFTKGMLPFSALFAHAVSQDGDALFPLIVMNRRSAFWATVVTTIPALLLGVLLYFGGVDAWILRVMPVTPPQIVP